MHTWSNTTKTLRDIEEFNAFLYKSGLYGELSDKQRTIFLVAKNGRATNLQPKCS